MSTSIDISKKPGRGRPKEDKARRRTTGIRFSESEEEMLRHLEIETGMSKTDLVRKAVRTLYPIELSRL